MSSFKPSERADQVNSGEIVAGGLFILGQHRHSLAMDAVASENLATSNIMIGTTDTPLHCQCRWKTGLNRARRAMIRVKKAASIAIGAANPLLSADPDESNFGAPCYLPCYSFAGERRRCSSW